MQGSTYLLPDDRLKMLLCEEMKGLWWWHRNIYFPCFCAYNVSIKKEKRKKKQNKTKHQTHHHQNSLPLDCTRLLKGGSISAIPVLAMRSFDSKLKRGIINE